MDINRCVSFRASQGVVLVANNYSLGDNLCENNLNVHYSYLSKYFDILCGFSCQNTEFLCDAVCCFYAASMTKSIATVNNRVERFIGHSWRNVGKDKFGVGSFAVVAFPRLIVSFSTCPHPCTGAAILSSYKLLIEGDGA
jgi:hypothetical protein